MDLSIIIPAYNECESLRELIARVDASARELTEEYEIVIIDDGSTDGSSTLARTLCESYSRLSLIECRRNNGKATALNIGFRRASGDTVVMMDADLQDDPAEIGKLIGALKEGWDCVVGWKEERQDPWSKRLPSRLFNGMVRMLSGVQIHDFNSGLKVFRREVTESLVLYGEMHRFVAVRAAWRGFRVTERSVKHHPRRHGKSKFGGRRFLRGFYDFLTVAFLMRYGGRPMHFFGLGGILTGGSGAVLCLHLTLRKFMGGEDLSYRPLLSLGVLLVVLGVLMFSTGFIAEFMLYLFRNREQSLPGYLVKRVVGGSSSEESE